MSIEELKLIRDLTEALRMLHDFQNGPPLEKYKTQWDQAMFLSKHALARAESFLKEIDE